MLIKINLNRTSSTNSILSEIELIKSTSSKYYRICYSSDGLRMFNKFRLFIVNNPKNNIFLFLDKVVVVKYTTNISKEPSLYYKFLFDKNILYADKMLVEFVH